MKKLYIILGVLACFVFIASPALAGGDVNVGQVGLYNKIGNIHTGDTINDHSIDKSIHNKATGGNVTVGDVKATIKEGAVQIGDVKAIIKEGAVVNNNKNKQDQDQDQKQDQGQDQGQNQGQMNNWTQIYEDKRDHVRGPEIVTPDAKFRQGRAFAGKVQGSEEFFTNVKGLTFKQAVKLSSEASDITCEPALFSENEFSTDRIKIEVREAIPGELMGYLYMGSDGKDVNAVSMIGEAAEEAMKAGATHMKLVDFGAGESAEGSAWNVGIGGGASLMSGTGGDAIAIAPNGGTGYGKAKAISELRPEMVFELRFDASYAAKYQLSKAGHGWSANLIEDSQRN